MRLSNLRIGRKLSLIAVLSLAQMCCVGGLALWCKRAVDLSEEQYNRHIQRQVETEKVIADIERLFVGVSEMAISARPDGGKEQDILSIRREYRGILDDLIAQADTNEERRLVGQIDKAAAPWREADDRVMKLLLAGHREEAAAVYEKDAFPRFEGVFNAVSDVLQWHTAKAKELAGSKNRLTARTTIVMLAAGIIALLCTIVFTVLITHGIAHPMGVAVQHLEEIAIGDLSRDAPPEFQTRGDEIGVLARAQQKMISSLREIIHEVNGETGTVSDSSSTLLASSAAMTAGSHTASEKAHSVAAAAEEMCSNVMSVAAGMEQTTTNLNSVASATEQMTATIGEIAGNSEKARRITADATRQATRITEEISLLGQAAREIGKVTETITEISSQTNLLALNATIEAARAGTAGKGFAVVANEIKTLAQQTAAATEDIKIRIAAVQSATASGIAEVEKVSRVIDDVSGIVASIAAAIEEQAAATRGIAANIGEASIGVADANKRISETSHVSREIARDIVDVDRSAGVMAGESDGVRSSATDLAGVAQKLRLAVGRFKV